MTTIKNLLFFIALLLANTTLADSYTKEEKNTNFVVTPSLAYRYDVFKWSVPHNRFPQQKLSELIWHNRIIQPGVKIELEPKSNQFTFLGQTKYGYILKSQSKKWDCDWEYHPSRLSSKTLSPVKGNILDLSGAIGYSVNLFNNNLLTLYVGYDYTDYRNKQYGGRQLAYNQNRIVRPFNELISKYYFKTRSPWIGLSLNSSLNDKWSIIPTIKLYSFKYIGKGYWLLRGDLKQDPSFKHNAKGTGLGGDIDLIYKYSDNLDFKFNLEIKRFKMKTGIDTRFHSNYYPYRQQEFISIDRLFDLTLFSSSISAGFRYKL